MGAVRKFSGTRFSSLVSYCGILLLSTMLAACSGGGSDSATPATVTINGAAAKGPITGATITAYKLNADGSRAPAALGTATTDANGAFQLTLDPASADYVAVVLTGGSYVDEATGSTVSVGSDELEVYTRVPSSGSVTVNITPLTSIAAAQVREHIANDAQSLANAVANANREVSTVFAVGDVLTATLLTPDQLGGASQEQINYSLLLAGISQLDSDAAMQSAFDILGEIAGDVADDGIWGNSGTVFDVDNLVAATNQYLLNNPGIGAALILPVSGVVDIAQAAADIDNRAPVAAADSVATDEDTAVVIPLADLLANDTDADGDTLSVTAFDAASAMGGTITDNGNGTLTYTPAADFNGQDTFEYTIGDGVAPGNTDTATVTVTVAPVNDAPTLTGTPATTVSQDSAYSFTPDSDDVDGDTLLFSIANKPAWASFDTATGALTGTPGSADVGTTTGIVISVDDQQGAPDSVQSLPAFNLTVGNVNDAPVISGTPATSVDEGTPYSFVPSASDIDGDPLLFSIANKPAWASFNTSTGELSGTPGNGDAGTTTGIVISVDDQQGFPNSVQSLPAFSLTVNGVNDAPVIGGTPDTSVDEDTAYSFVPTFSDGDGDTPLFSIANKPAWASFDTDTGELSGTPGNSDVGTTSGIVISVDDQQGAPDSVQSLPAFDLTVNNVNDAPTIGGTPATSVGEMAPYSFVPTASDVDPTMDTLTFSIVNQPSWASFDPNTGELSGTPGSGDAGVTTSGIVISVSDGIAPAVDLSAFDLSVLAGFNEALYASPSVSVSNNLRRQYQANDGIISDPDNGWVAGTSAAGSWIQMNFDTAKSIYRVDLRDLLDTANGQQVTGGSISFSDSSSIPFGALPADGTPEIVVFDPKQVNWVRVTLDSANVRYGLAEVGTYSLLDPNQAEIARDLFNDGNAAGWTEIANCDPSRGTASWDPAFSFFSGTGEGYEYQQSGDCAGFYAEGIEKGTYSRWDGIVPNGMDLRLSMRSDNVGDASGTGTNLVGGTMGVLFGYQDDNNYYRLDLSRNEGHRKLLKKEGGLFTELNTSPQNYEFGGWNGVDDASYSADGWIDVRIVHTNNTIVAYLDDVKVLAVSDNSFSDGEIALLCARNQSCTFDNVVMLEAPTDPILGTNVFDSTGHSSSEFFVDTGNSLVVQAVVTASTGFDAVEFVADEGTGSEQSFTDFSAPYSATFNSLSTGNHTVTAYLSQGGVRLSGAVAVDELPSIGVSGIHMVGLGDSITYGLYDELSGDDVSTDGRNTGGGYTPVLNSYLTASDSKPVTVLNEGNRGEAAIEAQARIASVVGRYPAAQAFLLIYGANDSGTQPGGGSPIDSGLLTVPNTANPVTFKDAMQKMIDTIEAAGKKVYLSYAPPHLSDPTRDARIVEYNQVIDELMVENGYAYTPPDFHTYFTINQGQMYDALHPNGTGYASIARLWCEALDGVDGISCTP